MISKIRERFPNLGWLFLLTVVAPTIVATLYFGLFASDAYISESRFVVRSPEKPSAAAGLGLLLKSAGFSNTGDEVFATREYLLSRDALAAFNANSAVARAYGAPSVSIFDRYDPIGWNNSFEDLYRFYRKNVTLEQESPTITTLRVRAFTAADATRINRQLLSHAEAMVNRLNTRGRADLIEYAKSEVQEAKQDAQDAALALARFRNREGLVDPEKQATVQLQMISKLQDQVIVTRTQLRQLETFAPRNPEIPVLRTTLTSLDREIQEQLGKVAGDQRSLAGSAVEYQRLMLDNVFTEKQLAAAMASLQDAQNEARRKQAYLETIVLPNLPDEPLEPKRLRGVIATFILGLVAWGIASMLIAGIREHSE